MADRITTERRSAVMGRIRKTDTKPEMIVRRLALGLGYRYCLHRRDLPGTPDLVFPARRKVVFVNGCFWHQQGCALCRAPKSRLDYWLPKLCRNQERDRESRASLSTLGWGSETIWECEIADPDRISDRLRRFLGPKGRVRRTYASTASVLPRA